MIHLRPQTLAQHVHQRGLSAAHRPSHSYSKCSLSLIHSSSLKKGNSAAPEAAHSAGSQVNNSPSARTSYVSGSTSMLGVAELWIISALPIFRQFCTGPAACAVPAAPHAGSRLCETNVSAGRLRRSAKRSEHWTVKDRLRRRNRRVRVAHHAPGNEPSLDHHLRLDAKECGLPHHQVRQLAALNRSHLARNPMRDCRD